MTSLPLIPMTVAEMSINTLYLHAWHSFREVFEYQSSWQPKAHCARDTEGPHPRWRGWDVELLGERNCRLVDWELHWPQRHPLLRETWNTSLSLLWMPFTSPVKQEYWCQLWAPHFVLRSGDGVWKCFVKSKMLRNSFFIPTHYYRWGLKI